MALTSLNDIKNWFKTNFIPTQQQFWDMFDSFRHKNDKVAATDVDGLNNLLADKASNDVFLAHLMANNAHAVLFGAKVDKVVGKALSDQNYSLAEKEKLAGLYDWVNNQIAGATIGSISLGSITPTTTIPTTLNVHGIAMEAGTYANCGGVVVPTNSLAFISRIGGVWSISKTAFDLSTYQKIVDGNKINPWTAKPYLSGDQVNYLGKDWVSNAATLSTDIPGTSTKWEERLTGYVKNDNLKTKKPDSFYFTDAVGNVMFEIGVSGVKSTAYKIIDPITKNEVVSLNKTWYDALTAFMNSVQTFSGFKETLRNNGYYFTDAVGNVMAKLTPSGLQAIKFINKNGEELGSAPKKLDGKMVVSIGDSHATGAWLSKFCSLTGSSYNSTLQSYILNNQYNYTDSGIMMGIAKALNQYSVDNSITPDVILIENCHFANDDTKSISDYVPMIYDNLQIYGTTYGSYSTFTSNINADKAAFIASLTPKIKTALRFNFATFKDTITFSSTGALTAGTIQLTINGSIFPINVTAGMTLSQAVTAMNDWAFNESVSNWTNAATKGSTRTNTIELVYTGTSNPPSEPTFSFNGGTTGMSMTTHALSSTTGFQDYYFNSLLLGDWNNSAKWNGPNRTTTYPAMMGLIEYLKNKFPTAEVVVWAVQWLSVSNTPSDANSYMVETYAGSGVYNRSIYKYYQDSSVAKYLKSKEAMRLTAQYYGCRFIDVDSNCGINIYNMFNGYFSANNLHPLTPGYEKWGQTLAQLY